MSDYKQVFKSAASKIDRDGISNILEWLENETDFFEAPSSSKFHGNYKGGLVEHSIHVLQFALGTFNYLAQKKTEYSYLKESVILCSLFHDICKVNTYEEGQRFTKNNDGKWVNYMGWNFKDEFPLGHGEKSIYYISPFIELKQSEALAIRWHMAKFEPGTSINDVTKWTFERAWQHPLVKIIHSADIMAATLDGFIDYESQAKNKG